MITSNNLPSHEMIGLRTEIVKSSNSQILGLNGVIINETKSMFVISTDSGIKNIPKDINTWKFSVNNEQKEIEGASLTKRSYERLGRKI
jgi:ribonuclease P protein subunit POP4